MRKFFERILGTDELPTNTSLQQRLDYVDVLDNEIEETLESSHSVLLEHHEIEHDLSIEMERIVEKVEDESEEDMQIRYKNIEEIKAELLKNSTALEIKLEATKKYTEKVAETKVKVIATLSNIHIPNSNTESYTNFLDSKLGEMYNAIIGERDDKLDLLDIDNDDIVSQVDSTTSASINGALIESTWQSLESVLDVMFL